MIFKIGIKGLILFFFFGVLKGSERVGQIFVFLRVHLTAVRLVHLLAGRLVKVEGLISYILLNGILSRVKRIQLI